MSPEISDQRVAQIQRTRVQSRSRRGDFLLRNAYPPRGSYRSSAAVKQESACEVDNGDRVIAGECLRRVVASGSEISPCPTSSSWAEVRTGGKRRRAIRGLANAAANRRRRAASARPNSNVRRKERALVSEGLASGMIETTSPVRSVTDRSAYPIPALPRANRVVVSKSGAPQQPRPFVRMRVRRSARRSAPS